MILWAHLCNLDSDQFLVRNHARSSAGIFGFAMVLCQTLFSAENNGKHVSNLRCNHSPSSESLKLTIGFVHVFWSRPDFLIEFTSQSSIRLRCICCSFPPVKAQFFRWSTDFKNFLILGRIPARILSTF